MSGPLVEALARLLSSSNFWGQLQYSAQHIVPQGCTFEVVLECPMLNAVSGEFVASIVEMVHVDFAFFCKGPVLDIAALLDALEYGFSSMVLQWEQRYPLVFGRAARAGFRKNYVWLKRMLAEIEVERDEDEKEEDGKREQHIHITETCHNNAANFFDRNSVNFVAKRSGVKVELSKEERKLRKTASEKREVLQCNMEGFHQQHSCSIIERARKKHRVPQLRFWHDLQIEETPASI